MKNWFRSRKSAITQDPHEQKSVHSTPSWWERFREQLGKSTKQFGDRLRSLLNKHPLDENLFEEIENLLLSADVGFATTELFLAKIKLLIRSGKIKNSEDILQQLHQDMHAVLLQAYGTGLAPMPDTTTLISLVGVNGAGKTTTLAKLGHFYQQQGWNCLLVAGDTFRAAAAAQLDSWAKKLDLPMIVGSEKADPASVLYDGLASAKAKKKNMVLADTAGRLHHHEHLMKELDKTKRVAEKFEQIDQHVWLVIDGSMGQNSLQQARQFHQQLGLNGMIITKLDGTAKGGVVFQIVQELQLPIHFLSTGEQLSDLYPFDADLFIQSLLGDNQSVQSDKQEVP